jgi:hypothetical protein
MIYQKVKELRECVNNTIREIDEFYGAHSYKELEEILGEDFELYSLLNKIESELAI